MTDGPIPREEPTREEAFALFWTQVKAAETGENEDGPYWNTSALVDALHLLYRNIGYIEDLGDAT